MAGAPAVRIYWHFCHGYMPSDGLANMLSSRWNCSINWRAFALLLLLGLASCSSVPDSEKLYPATGKVLFNDQPAKGATVTFHPKDVKNELTAKRPTAVVRDDGTFALMTGASEGAPAGEYSVTIYWPEPLVAPKKGKIMSTDMDVPMTDKLKGAYSEKSKSQLTRQIKQGRNELEPIVLK